MKWISVKDKLPEPNNWVLYAVLVDDPGFFRHQIAFYSVSNLWFLESAQDYPLTVTHWTSLPNLPDICF